MNDSLKAKFTEEFGYKAEYVFSASGRSELGGNHTDHQHGCVLAAAVNLPIKAAVGRRDDNLVRVVSEGFGCCEINLKETEVLPQESGSTAALVRGIAAKFIQDGKDIPGFNAFVQSEVLPGSGLSSSAAFEVLIAKIFNELSGAAYSAINLARIGQYAENVYFGKPCGLMDQTACACGGIVAIDFRDPSLPDVDTIDFNFEDYGYSLCIIDTASDHSGLTDEYSAITEELKAVCSYFGKEHLRDVPEISFRSELRALRVACGDRAVLRAMHVYAENRRVEDMVAALYKKDMEAYLKLVKASGDSSYKLMQNVIPAGSTKLQPVAVALAAAEQMLCGFGACRVHGGGFAGTIQAYVPTMLLKEFTKGMDDLLGEASCRVLSVRKEGAMLEEVTV